MLWIIIIGFFVGLIARMIMSGRDLAGFIVSTLLGIAGSFLGSFVGRAFGFYREGQSGGFLMSLIGALLILWVFYAVSRPGTVGT